MDIVRANKSSPKECIRCLLSEDDGVVIEASGLCRLCERFDGLWKNVPKTKEESDALLLPKIEEIKRQGANKKYDCLIGVSGGVDSTYILLLAKQYGLRPLAVHFDNGWNSELAVKNIEKALSKLDFDLYTYVIDWEDFKKLQLAYLRASVVDIELPTDHAIYGAMFKIASEFDIEYVLSGVNIATEALMPPTWHYNKLDFRNIQSIYKRHGTGGKLKTYPFVTKKVKKEIAKSGVKIVRVLDMIVYDINKATKAIEEELGWTKYEGKHFESIFTRFYQGYILPTKFGMDKRKVHYSNLICSGQMTKEEAQELLKETNYSKAQIAEDKDFVLKKLELSPEEFDEIMQTPTRMHREFDTEGAFFSEYPILKPFQPIWQKLRKQNA